MRSLSAAVVERLSAKSVVAMRTDWTLPDAAVAGFLRGFDRYGILFYPVFGPAAPLGRPLPELLTQTMVLEAIDAATGPARRWPQNALTQNAVAVYSGWDDAGDDGIVSMVAMVGLEARDAHQRFAGDDPGSSYSGVVCE
jgi:hypothetical protein